MFTLCSIFRHASTPEIQAGTGGASVEANRGKAAIFRNKMKFAQHYAMRRNVPKFLFL
jgi:hypothetical protein